MSVRWHWGTSVSVVYGAFALGTLGMVWLSITLPVDLVSPDYYSQSLAYDGRIAAIERADALGGAVLVGLEPNQRTLTIGVPAADARTARGSVTLYRPSASTADRTFALALDASGAQRIPLGDLAPGLWRVRVQWEVAGRAFYREQVIQLRTDD